MVIALLKSIDVIIIAKIKHVLNPKLQTNLMT